MERHEFNFETKSYVLEHLVTFGKSEYTLYLVTNDGLDFVHHFHTFEDFVLQHQKVLQDFASCNFEWPLEDF